MKVLRDFKEIFREDVTCENSTSHRKTGFNLSLNHFKVDITVIFYSIPHSFFLIQLYKNTSNCLVTNIPIIYLVVTISLNRIKNSTYISAAF